MDITLAPEPEVLPEGYTTSKVRYVESLHTRRSSIGCQSTTVSHYVAKLRDGISARNTLFEALPADTPSRVFFDFDRYVQLHATPGPEELASLHETNISTIRSFMLLHDPTQTFDPQHHLQSAQRHREVKHGGEVVFKVSFRYYVPGYKALLPQLKAAVLAAKADGLFAEEGWDAAVYPTTCDRLLNSVLCGKGKGGDCTILRPMLQPDGSLPELHKYIVGYTYSTDVELFNPQTVPQQLFSFGSGAYGAATPATPAPAAQARGTSPATTPCLTSPFVGTPTHMAAPAAHLEGESVSMLTLKALTGLSTLFGGVDGFQFRHLRGDEMYFKTAAEGRACAGGVRHSSNNFVVNLRRDGSMAFKCFSDKCAAHKNKIIGIWRTKPASPTQAFDKASVTPAQLREFSPALMARASDAAAELPKDDPAHQEYEAFVVWYYNEHLVFVEGEQPDVLQVRTVPCICGVAGAGPKTVQMHISTCICTQSSPSHKKPRPHRRTRTLMGTSSSTHAAA